MNKNKKPSRFRCIGFWAFIAAIPAAAIFQQSAVGLAQQNGSVLHYDFSEWISRWVIGKGWPFDCYSIEVGWSIYIGIWVFVGAIVGWIEYSVSKWFYEAPQREARRKAELQKKADEAKRAAEDKKKKKPDDPDDPDLPQIFSN